MSSCFPTYESVKLGGWLKRSSRRRKNRLLTGMVVSIQEGVTEPLPCNTVGIVVTPIQILTGCIVSLLKNDGPVIPLTKPWQSEVLMLGMVCGMKNILCG